MSSKEKAKPLVITVPDSLDTLLTFGVPETVRKLKDDGNYDDSIGMNAKNNSDRTKQDQNGESKLASTSEFTVPDCLTNIDETKDEVLSTTSSSEMITFEEIDAEALSTASSSDIITFEGIEAEILIPVSSSEIITFEEITAGVLSSESTSEMITLQEIKAEVIDAESPSETSALEGVTTAVLNPASLSEMIPLEEIKAEVPESELTLETSMLEEIKEEALSPASSSDTITFEDIKEEVPSPASASVNENSVDYPVNATSASTEQKPKRRVRQPECKCPYCIAEGGNKTKGPNGKPQHICHFSHCGKIFGYAKSLYRHLITHSGKRNFVCAHCNKGFVRQDSLKVHVMIHMTDNKNKGRWIKCECASCTKGGKKADCLEKKWRYVCHYPDCGRAYTQIGNLQRHLQLHSGKKSFNCAHCDKGYARKDLLGWHMQIHMNEGRKWARCQCPYCSADGDVKMRAPGGKLQHICHMPNCGKVYNNSWQLKRHLESHSGKKNYSCPQCGKGFTRQDSFDRHVKNHNEIKQMKVNGRRKRKSNLHSKRMHTNIKRNELENIKIEEGHPEKPINRAGSSPKKFSR